MKYEVNPKDLDDAIRYFTRNYKHTIDKSSFFLYSFKFQDPKEMLHNIYPLNQKSGWLVETYKKDQWLHELEVVEVRQFKQIIKRYFEGKLTTVIQINDKLCDGFGRCIFYHAIGENILTAKFYSKTQKKIEMLLMR